MSRQAFHGIPFLNRLQSRLFHAAYETNENLLVLAPTGAGKTNVAMTCIAREIENKSPRLVKVVYIAPMKVRVCVVVLTSCSPFLQALAQEVVAKFGERLAPLRMSVRELTGDTQLSRAELERTQVMCVLVCVITFVKPYQCELLTSLDESLTALLVLRLTFVKISFSPLWLT
jgi:activating signal cointegrator complex subunit 3